MTREIPLTRGYVALVDDEDYPTVVALGPWHVKIDDRRRYAAHSVSRSQKVVLHRFLTGVELVDHVNGDGLDNRRANLRRATDQQNSWNRGMRSDNTSGYKGAKRHTGGRWQATISGRYLGLFPTAEDAARAYDAAALDQFGEYARLNFPPP